MRSGRRNGFEPVRPLVLRPAISQAPCPELFEVETVGSSHAYSGSTRSWRNAGQCVMDPARSDARQKGSFCCRGGCCR